ncbi:MAG: methyltransferase domain-containing protein [Planctomycetota bacterium]
MPAADTAPPSHLTPDQLQRLADLVRTQVLHNLTDEELAGGRSKFLFEQHCYLRYRRALENLAPWVDRAVPLAGRRVIEIGSGSGSSTAGFAALADRVIGLEIKPQPVEVAKQRFEILDVTNAEIHVIAPDELPRVLVNELRPDDVLLFYAVLEHMTVAERVACLQAGWRALGEGGALVVIETPNRLTYFDRHTADLPFFHLLDLELAERYYERSPRLDFVRRIRGAGDRQLEIARAGRGVSYHDFEVAFERSVSDLVVADGFEPLAEAVYPGQEEDQLLADYFALRGVQQHRAFTRRLLNIVFQKREPPAPARLATPRVFDLRDPEARAAWQPLRHLEPLEGGDALRLRSIGQDPALVSPDFDLPAEELGVFRIRMRLHNPDFGVHDGRAELFWLLAGDTNFTPEQCITFPVVNDGERYEYAVDLGAALPRHARLRRLRFDPVNGPCLLEIEHIEV